MERYQLVWSDTFGDWVEIVLRAAEAAGKLAPETYAAEVILEAPQDIDTADFVAAIGAVSESMTRGSLDSQAAQGTTRKLVEMMLADFGVHDADEVMTSEVAAELGTLLAAVRANLDGGSVEPSQVIEFLIGALADG